jgi:hypothetical protein
MIVTDYPLFLCNYRREWLSLRESHTDQCSSFFTAKSKHQVILNYASYT